jgi:pyruvate dehydrogenase E2 component (dihydrolipoamide acetyltransferase)
MAEAVKMPKMSDTMTEGVLAKWHKKVGDKIKSGDVLAEVETDKATMDFESFQDGTLLYIGVEEGKSVPVDAVIAVIGKEGEDYKAALEADGSSKTENKEEKPAENAAPKPTEDKKPVAAAQPAVDLAGIPASVVRMPKMSDTMTEGVLAKWHKKVGDKVKPGDVLAEVETDKATMDFESFDEGTLLYIGVEEGKSVPVDEVIAVIGKEGTDFAPLLKNPGTVPAADTAPAMEQATTSTSAETETSDTATSSEDDSRIKASPLARKIAKEKGINLNDIKGSAEGGRIVKKDVENYTPAAKAEQPVAPAVTAAEAPKAEKTVNVPQYFGVEKYTEKPVSQMRKVIAKRLSESLFTAPHFYVTITIDMDQAVAARTRMNEVAPVKISFNDFVVKACAVALKQHPNINSSWLGDKIRYNEHVNIGIAVAVEEGLLVPVVRFADGKSLSQISVEVKEYAQKAKAKKLQPSDWEGSTFTISNLGMFGVDEFTAIINPPDACILAVSGIQQVPVVKNGAIVPGNVMKVTLSCDHRVVDGATGAAFLQTLKSLLEEPVRLLI